LDLFRYLGSDIIDEAEHHATRSKESYPGKYHHIMAPHLPDQVTAIVNQMMLEACDTAH